VTLRDDAGLDRLAPPPGSRLLVVGGCGGIGREVVSTALACGLRVVVFDLPASIERHPPPLKAFAMALDASDEDGVIEAFADLELHMGGLDAMVNLVGFRASDHRLEDLPLEKWREAIDGNLTSAFLLSRAALRLMRKSGGGSIVHVSSGMGVYGSVGYGGYAVSKGGINTLVRSLAREGAPTIRANAVAPSLVETAFTHGGTGRSDEARPSTVDREAYVRRIPLGRVAAPADVVGPIMFLAGPASRYVNGQVLQVNGGLHMG
jgi:3-oxoacyl-[acyl-carrier protein] reductase